MSDRPSRRRLVFEDPAGLLCFHGAQRRGRRRRRAAVPEPRASAASRRAGEPGRGARGGAGPGARSVRPGPAPRPPESRPRPARAIPAAGARIVVGRAGGAGRNIGRAARGPAAAAPSAGSVANDIATGGGGGVQRLSLTDSPAPRGLWERAGSDTYL